MSDEASFAVESGSAYPRTCENLYSPYMVFRIHRLGESMARNARSGPYYAFVGDVGRVGPHRHDYTEVLAVLAGEGRHIVLQPGGVVRAERLLPGRMYLFRPIDVHELFAVGAEGITVIDVAFPAATWEAFVDLGEVDRRWATAPDPPMIEFDPADPEALRPFHLALERFERGATAMDLLAFLTAVIPAFVPEEDLGVIPSTPSWLVAALAAFQDEENLAGGVPRLRDLCQVSATHLWRCTRRYLGLTPTELVTHLRLRRAVLLLVTTDDSIADVAQRCGFASHAYFTRAFRRMHVVPPSEYRARART